MEACRELDALVAEKVMGWSEEKIHYGMHETGYLRVIDSEIYFPIPRYSKSIEDAWKVVEKMYETGHGYCLERAHDASNWTVHFLHHASSPKCTEQLIYIVEEMERISQDAESLPHAICLAALKAVGVEVE